MLTNIILIIILLLGLLFYILYRIRDPQPAPKQEVFDPKVFSFASMTDFLKQAINDLTNSSLYDKALSEEQFNRLKNRRADLKRALKGCTSGDVYDKTFVKEFMFELFSKSYKGLNEQSINLVIPFDDPNQLTPQDKFEILLHVFKQKQIGMGRNIYLALAHMIETGKWDELKPTGEEDTEGYIITAKEIDALYRSTIVQPLSFTDKLYVVVQRIYQYYKGFGPIDEIRDMTIDGVSGGVSGLPSTMTDMDEEVEFFNRMKAARPDNFDSIWIMYRGKTIHLPFLSFGSELELKRVCQNIYKHNNPGQLTETNGFIVNDMKDGSRVVVVRPPFAESWAFFVRKFDLTIISLEDLLNPKGKGYTYKNTHLPIRFLPFLMKGARNAVVSGEQGSGKSTLMMALAKFIYSTLPLRIQEMAFELHLRKLYRHRNILTFRKTDTISGQDGLDLSKKTDGGVNIIGEVATDEQAIWQIQGAQTYKFSMSSHHSLTLKTMVESFRNSLLKTGVFRNETIAEQQVVEVLHFNIKMSRDYDGRRYIERISEIVPVGRNVDLPDNYEQAAVLFFKHMMDPKNYEENIILLYEDGEYVAVNPVTPSMQKEMMRNMSPKDRAAFLELMTEWGGNA